MQKKHIENDKLFFYLNYLEECKHFNFPNTILTCNHPIECHPLISLLKYYAKDEVDIRSDTNEK